MKDKDEKDNGHDQDDFEGKSWDTDEKKELYENFETSPESQMEQVVEFDSDDDENSDDISEMEDEVFSNSSEDLDDNDPLSEAYELASSEEDPEESIQRNTRIASPEEFFKTELLHRYDILDPSEKKDISGRYRLEIRGTDGGVWTLSLDKELSVVAQKEDADLILMMHADDFISVVNGKINPQIALASRRIKISGNPKKASLFQNLLAPRAE